MSELGRDYPRVATLAYIEAVLAAIWKELLGIDRVEVSDNFFELGGHSLLATQVVRRVRERLGVEVPFGEIINVTTVRELAAVVIRFVSIENEGKKVGNFQHDSLHVIADLEVVPTELVAELMSNLNDLHRALGGAGLYVRSIETGSEAVAEEAFV